jgi:hypothetical protein
VEEPHDLPMPILRSVVACGHTFVVSHFGQGWILGHHFIRPHRALKFGREVRTPSMQAGLTRRQLTFREIFEAGIALTSKNVLFVLFESVRRVRFAAQGLALAA